MKSHDSLKKSGILKAYIIDPKWRGAFPTRLPKEQWPVIEQVFEKPNMLMSAGRLKANRTGLNFNFIAGGTGISEINVTDKALRNEVQRFAVTDTVYALGQIDVFSEIPPGTGNFTWHEWGVFMDDASVTRSSGTMFSRILQEYTKVLGNTVLLNYTLLETV